MSSPRLLPNWLLNELGLLDQDLSCNDVGSLRNQNRGAGLIVGLESFASFRPGNRPLPVYPDKRTFSASA